MGKTNKDLLHLEHKNPSTSSLESALLVCKKNSLDSQIEKKTNPDQNSFTCPIPKSQVLGKVKDFLGVASEANERLQLDAKDNSENFDIEVLTGDESQVIEMDLMLGIADLHTPEAVAAAESAISGYQPVIPLADSSSESKSESESELESEDSSDEDDDSDDDDNDEVDDVGNRDGKTLSSTKPKRSKSNKDNSSSEVAKESKSRKRPKIVEL